MWYNEHNVTSWQNSFCPCRNNPCNRETLLWRRRHKIYVRYSMKLTKIDPRNHTWKRKWRETLIVLLFAHWNDKSTNKMFWTRINGRWKYWNQDDRICFSFLLIKSVYLHQVFLFQQFCFHESTACSVKSKTTQWLARWHNVCETLASVHID